MCLLGLGCKMAEYSHRVVVDPKEVVS
eukprot:SAG11_NODE_11307_length_769_cov_1.925373_1_plen_26_part_01